LADHRDLDDGVDEWPGLLRHATFVTKQDNGSLPSRLEPRERHLGEFDGDHDASPLAFVLDPGELRPVEPMDVWPPPERVAAYERSSVVFGRRDSDARADGVARPEQRPEVRLVGNPKRSDDEVVDSAVPLSGSGGEAMGSRCCALLAGDRRSSRAARCGDAESDDFLAVVASWTATRQAATR
jgi:hypothetical protein